MELLLQGPVGGHGQRQEQQCSPGFQAGPYLPGHPVPSQSSFKLCCSTEGVQIIQFSPGLSICCPPQSPVAALCCWELSWARLVSREEMEQSWDAAMNPGDAIPKTTCGHMPGLPGFK